MLGKAQETPNCCSCSARHATMNKMHMLLVYRHTCLTSLLTIGQTRCCCYWPTRVRTKVFQRTYPSFGTATDSEHNGTISSMSVNLIMACDMAAAYRKPLPPVIGIACLVAIIALLGPSIGHGTVGDGHIQGLALHASNTEGPAPAED